jgi:hypothetical protein
MLDSKAVFLARLRAVGIPDGAATLFCTSGVDTMAKLTFVSNSQPGMGDDSAFLQMLVKNLHLTTVADLNDGELAGWRRVWFESHTIVVSDLRQKVERTEDSAPRRLPVPERAAKLAAQQARLFGVAITGALVPSYSLIDFTVGMREDEMLKYIEPAMCTSREDELLGVKREQFVRPNAAGMLVVKESEATISADLTSEHRVRMALQRRSLALDQADLLPYAKSEEYHAFLFSLTTMEPPPRFMHIDVVQILNADRAIWSRMGEHTSAGISIRPSGEYPIELALALARAHPMVACLLQPLPKPAGGSNKQARDGPYSTKGDRGNQSKGKGKGQKAKGKGKGEKGKSKGKSGPMPHALIGCKSKTADGSRICFDFNLQGGCSREVSNGKCSAGAHACAGCLGTSHGYVTCSRT